MDILFLNKLRVYRWNYEKNATRQATKSGFKNQNFDRNEENIQQ
jgi:hypothetical protein